MRQPVHQMAIWCHSGKLIHLKCSLLKSVKQLTIEFYCNNCVFCTQAKAILVPVATDTVLTTKKNFNGTKKKIGIEKNKEDQETNKNINRNQAFTILQFNANGLKAKMDFLSSS